MIDLSKQSPNEIVVISTIIGILIANKLNLNQQNLVGNVLEGIGQVILVINAQQTILQQQGNGSNNNTNTNSSCNDLQKQIDELKKQLDELRNC